MATIEIDGKRIEADEGDTVLAAALASNIYIPHLCSHPDLPPGRSATPSEAVYRAGERIEHDGGSEPFDGCGLCFVEVEGYNEPQHACDLPAHEGTVVRTDSPELTALRRQRLAVILAHHPHACITCAQKEGCSREPCSTGVPVTERCCPLLGRCELEKVASYIGVPPEVPRYVPRGLPVETDILFRWEPELCVGCLRCVRACSDLKGVNALGWVRHAGEVVVGRLGPDTERADCRLCGACVEVCPTGALTDRDVPAAGREARLVPCRSGCPAGMDVPRFLRAVGRGDLEDAARVAMDRLPLPNSLGRVCFHPCEGECRRSDFGGPLSVCRLRRHVFDSISPDSLEWQPSTDTPHRVAVIGAGPAGLAAAHFLRRSGHHVTIFEAEAEAGGMLRYGIPEYRLPREVLDRDLELITAQGVELRLSQALGNDVTLEGLRAGGYEAVIITAGAGAPRPLPIDGTDLDGVMSGIDLLKEVASGTFDRTSLQGRRTVVIGGGNVAIDAARTAVRLGAAEIILACLEREEEMPAYRSEVEEARAEGVTILPSWGPSEILNGDGRVSGIRLVRCTAVFDAAGRFAPTYDRETVHEIGADAVILAIGQQVSPSLGGIEGLELSDGGLLRVNLDDGACGGGLFGAGDIATGPASVVLAVAGARRAAESVDRFLGGDGAIASILEPEQPSQWLGSDPGFAARERAEAALAALDPRIAGFGEVEGPLDDTVARAEAARCLQCDLRFLLSPPHLPPQLWLALDAEAVAGVPERDGVYQLLSPDHVAIKIAGTPNLRRALEEELATGSSAAFFVFDEDPMYTKRESELIQQFLAQHGHLPQGGDDELDDLF
ncbi:MAG: FAD-dependent oxidoreductase [Acidobacteria bacterium]|nr:FAD-dependent oxidoreductase [Acidobacteriota bacterium]